MKNYIFIYPGDDLNLENNMNVYYLVPKLLKIFIFKFKTVDIQTCEWWKINLTIISRDFTDFPVLCVQ